MHHPSFLNLFCEFYNGGGFQLLDGPSFLCASCGIASAPVGANTCGQDYGTFRCNRSGPESTGGTRKIHTHTNDTGFSVEEEFIGLETSGLHFGRRLDRIENACSRFRPVR
jgi:hypothetical protein